MSKERINLLVVVAIFVVLVLACGFIISSAKKRVELMDCISSVRSICYAARLWAEDHGGFMPTNFTCMSNEIGTPKILYCVPSQHAWTSNWASFTPENCTFEISAPGMRADETNRVFLRCKIHGHLGYSDATVFDGIRRRTKFPSVVPIP